VTESADACSHAFAELEVGANLLGLTFSPKQREQFIRYGDFVLDTGSRMNLTAVRTPQGIMRTLFLDSLTVSLALPEAYTAEPAHGRCRVVDVGAGAGVPGLALKIVYPHWSLALIESVRKKARFLEAAVRELELEDVTVLPERAEDLGKSPAWRDRADLCLARAVAALPSLVELCAPLVRAGALLIFPKRGDVEGEAQSAEAAMRAVRVRLRSIVDVPHDLGLGQGRALVVCDKVSATPSGYPRRTGLATSRPL
jgi:16S rRNA (guanine527-N7)-methyltransferase